MVAIQVTKALAAKLNAVAKAQGTSIEAVLEEFEVQHLSRSLEDGFGERAVEQQQAARIAVAGIFDDDVSDLSETVHDSVSAYLRKKHDRAS
jgi:hypothetical protein